MKKYILTFAALTLSLASFALETEKGQLSSLINAEEASSLTTLTLTGTMDARDFAYISESLTALETLNLEGVTIEEYSDEKAVTANFTYYPANAIPQYALSATSLRSIVLPASLTAIEEGAFAGCRQLSVIEIPATVTSIGECAFAAAENLTHISGCSGIIEIGANAFRGDALLTELPAMEKLQTIGNSAFAGCTALTDIVLPATLQTIGESAMQATSISTFDAKDLTSLQSVGDWSFANDNALIAVTLPTSASTIGDGAFFGSSALQDLTISEGTTRLGDFTLTGCSALTTLNLPASLESIGERAMRGCIGLKQITASAVVPATLGDAVWEGVNTADIKLLVPDDGESAYRTAEQWKEFYIASNTQTTKLLNDDGVGIFRTSNLLTIKSNIPLKQVSIYSIDGSLTAQANDCQAAVSFDLSEQSSPAYIIVCKKQDGRVVVKKIIL